MSDVVIFKAEDGKLQGFGEKGGRSYARWQKEKQLGRFATIEEGIKFKAKVREFLGQRKSPDAESDGA